MPHEADMEEVPTIAKMYIRKVLPKEAGILGA
jgi:hypothetical protein